MAATAPILWLAMLAATAAPGQPAAPAPDSLPVPATAAAAAPVHGHPDFVIDGTRVHAVRVTAAVTVDGVLSEPVWQEAEAFSALVQRDPTEGAPPSQRTEVRIAYDDDAIYIGARLYDTAPDSIVARLARRDASIASDRFAVYLDPQHDRRSGYYFMVNAAGTLYDGTLSNDVEQDASWDAVWKGSARIDRQGWTVEMRIPYSQLRFPKQTTDVWGINFSREIPRRREKDYAVYRPRKESGFVSRFPDLVGIENISPRRSIEVLPYVTTQYEHLDHDPGDPFNNGARTHGKAGGDLRARVASRLTLNATVNPDFGQVEIDPAIVNLTDVESFVQEKRPFFVEGASTLAFGRQGAGDYWDFDWDDPLFFYSRRIGRAPQGEVPAADFSDVPVATRILGAAKLTGRLSPQWSLGTLYAVTDREYARLSTAGTSWQSEVEPLTYYGATRVQREFGGRRAGLGLLSTTTVRSFDDPALRDQLNSSSWMGGLDGWMFLDRSRTWVLTGWSALSHVAGNDARMVSLQRNSVHYFQRPDAPQVEVDSAATSLTGYASRFWLNKEKGAVQFNAGLGVVNPKFEVNDLGFQTESDIVNGHIGSGYKWTRSTRFWRYQSVKAALFSAFDYGGNATLKGGEVSGYTEFHNGHTLDYYTTVGAEAYDNRRTRGGPLMLNPARLTYGMNYLSDTQRQLYVFSVFDAATSRSGSWSFDVYPGFEWKPTAAFSLKVVPGYERVREDAQFVTSFDDPAAAATFGRRYVFATLDQQTASASFWVNWTFTPSLSLQTYIQPFVSAATYRDFKSLARARSYDFTPAPYESDLDFTERSLRGNAVLRWEYRPGSALFLVWTQSRSSSESSSQFSLNPLELVGVPPEDVFLIKATYYFTP
jgi:hypothetical protein